MNKPLASCVCVTYNRPHLLNELLYCFLNQTYENKELIIVNDQPDVKYIYNNSNVKIFNLNKRFSSLGSKRNYSKGLIKGDYIFIMDDDDIFYSNHIKSLINIHLENPSYDIVLHKKGHYSKSNKNVEEYDVQVAFNCVCIKKNYIQKNIFNNKISCGEDQDFIKNAKVKFFNDNEITSHYRWGLGIHHMSGMGGDGIESYGIVTKNTPIGETRTIVLQPQISDEVKEYYK